VDRGGHLQADSGEELHQFAARLGLKRDWFQSRPGRPELDHYDLTRGKRQQALRLGAVAESAARRAIARGVRHAAPLAEDIVITRLAAALDRSEEDADADRLTRLTEIAVEWAFRRAQGDREL